jgi:hypothetical protein
VNTIRKTARIVTLRCHVQTVPFKHVVAGKVWLFK